MRPEEKAKELINKYHAFLMGAMDLDDGYRLAIAKELSLIQCEEFLMYFPEDNFQEYWQQVKQEILKL